MSLRLAIVAGEESGDLLGADLVAALKASGQDVTLTGVGGAHLQAEGLVTLFDPAEIALMGLSAIVRSLPRLMRRIRQTAAAILAAKPDVLVIIDSPEFTHRVAKRVRAADPSIRIVNYVCPSVWAWRPERAPAMRAYVDLVLCLLPFAPAELARLGGPDGVYVGHRLANDPDLWPRALKISAARRKGGDCRANCWFFPVRGAAKCAACLPRSARRLPN